MEHDLGLGSYEITDWDMKYNPYKVLEISDVGQWPDNVDPYEDAIKNFSPEDLTSLVRLLKSKDEFVSRHGLFLFGELGKRAFPIVDDALRLVNHPDMMARHNLMSGVLCYSKMLTSSQVQQVLTLTDDPTFAEGLAEVVRYQVIAFIGAIKVDVLSKAINQFSDKYNRQEHLEAHRASLNTITDLQHAFDTALGEQPLHLIYSLASLERAAREDVIQTAPTYSGEDYIASGVVMNIQRIIGNNLRRKDPAAWRELALSRRKV